MKHLKSILASIQSKFKKPILFYDVESTGTNVDKDEIIEIFICTYDGKEYNEHEERFNCKGSIGEGASAKHGIYKEDIAELPYFSERASAIWSIFNKFDYVICGYNHPKFDNPILINSLVRGGIKDAPKLLRNCQFDVFDSYKQTHPNTLEAVFQRMTGETLERAHEARYDIYATLRIGEELLNNFDIEVAPSKILDMDGFFIIEDGSITFNTGKYKTQKLKNIPVNDLVGYLNWMIGNERLTAHTRQVAQQIKAKLLK